MSLAPVFKALADPSRRRMLDLLRKGPRTTGELASAFREVSRFAVMKHLAVLVEAKLVVPRRQGRERWNHLNAVPLQQIYERWVRPYEAHWAKSLINLKTRIEGDVAMANKNEAQAQVGQVEVEIGIEAPRERVWKALVEDITLWWPKDFYARKDVKAFVFEPKLGGKVYEDYGDGDGATWFTVVAIQRGKSVDMVGHLTAAYGGPTFGVLSLMLEGEGKKTLLKVCDAMVGRLPNAADAEKGWKMIFGDGLKAFVEKQERV